ncbi:30S ribosomal protein S4 [bacterium]|nr:30S ribosomal protein S4 [bacterium]MBP9808070.1 30S ribosomal protein S4 [bacterium]MDP3506580.1 30S ribosomal protein S4 [Candidatus Melainabacteria bacterium]
MRYTKSICKRCRSVGASLCGKPKCAFIRKPFGPGQHGQDRKKTSEYSLQLKAKQQIRWTYDVSESQFYSVYEEATRAKDVTGTVMLQILESRLDNILYRSGLVGTRRQARQVITHGHVQVNGKRLNIASARMRPGDVITVDPKSAASVKPMNIGLTSVTPTWLKTDAEQLKVEYVLVPDRESLDQTFKENLVIEYYSR